MAAHELDTAYTLASPPRTAFPDAPISSDVGRGECEKMAAFIEFDDASAAGMEEIETFHKNTPSFMPSLLEVPESEAQKPVPLQRGIPLETLEQSISDYARMTITAQNRDTPMGTAIEAAKDLMQMERFFAAVETELGSEEFLNFMLLFDQQARESPTGEEFKVTYNGQTMPLEDAKFKLRYHTEGANILAPHETPQGYVAKHVLTHGSAFFGDDFVAEVSPNVSVYQGSRAPFYPDPQFLTPEQKEYRPFETLDVALLYAQQSASYSSEFQFRKIGESLNKNEQTLAKEFVEKVLSATEHNRRIDFARDVTFEVLDAIITVVAVVSGAIALKAAFKGVISTVSRVGMFVLSANYGIQAMGTLRNRWLGVRGAGYNPLLDFSKAMDKKIGGHKIETTFHAINTLMVFGKQIKVKVITGSISASAGGYLGSRAAWTSEQPTAQAMVENAAEAKEGE
ncbi:hypothetical protein [Pectobacterium parmentieri]|uniref:hypothetical protein n=1 Tax=Pectobacterium parmentieri TaxID=1905730 RepID=UPI0018DF11FE|nr:hypothetical protein [Pectobacterium parmentieri]MBI0549182.1 hypothetical protein [Pectobacterium parmentieri]MBI0558202.1 hypothetical protein [Pectobacterium parmentieri]MBI0562255.1 hypothetical protein [Pectobacterium parmentieri]